MPGLRRRSPARGSVDRARRAALAGKAPIEGARPRHRAPGAGRATDTRRDRPSRRGAPARPNRRRTDLTNQHVPTVHDVDHVGVPWLGWHRGPGQNGMTVAGGAHVALPLTRRRPSLRNGLIDLRQLQHERREFSRAAGVVRRQQQRGAPETSRNRYSPATPPSCDQSAHRRPRRQHRRAGSGERTSDGSTNAHHAGQLT